MLNNINVAFVGLTHLGLNYLAATAEKKIKVMGLDLNEEKISKLKENIFDYDEPNLKRLITKNKNRISFSSNFNFLKN